MQRSARAHTHEQICTPLVTPPRRAVAGSAVRVPKTTQGRAYVKRGFCRRAVVRAVLPTRRVRDDGLVVVGGGGGGGGAGW